MKNKVFINGRFLEDDISGGVKRFSVEVLKRLNLFPQYTFIVLHSKKGKTIEVGQNVIYKKVGLFFKGLKWEQITLPLYKLFHRGLLLNTANSMPFLVRNNAVVIHDVRLKEELNSGVSTPTHIRFNYTVKCAVRRKNIILTISSFSKERIINLFGANPSFIYVMRLGHEHIKPISKQGQQISQNIKEVTESDYYLTVNSISKHKNTSFIFDLARLHPDKTFCVTGKIYDDIQQEIPNNIKMLGLANDEEMALIYGKAKAFISPSLYEGFGLTPLEALSLGCKKLYLSDIEVFHEIFAQTATFFNPYDASLFTFNDKQTDLEAIKKVLNNYSWNNCVKDIMFAIEKKIS